MPEPTSAVRFSSDWVLVDTRTSVGRCNGNATTARSVTSTGSPISVTFELVDPPGLSRCVVDCPDLTPGDTRSPPCVTGADGAFLLIGVMFPECRSPPDVFLYGAGPGAPSLRLLPRPYPTDLHFHHVGVLSFRHEHCCVVVPKRRFEAGGHMTYDLQIFSTMTGAWSTNVAGVASYLSTRYYHGLIMHRQTKVLNVGGGSLAWVDLRRGMLLCNVLDDRPEMNLIRLPELMPANEEFFGDCSDGCEPPMRPIRDVTCTNGSVRFIEMEDVDDHSNTAAAMQYRWKATVFKTTINSRKWEWCRTIKSDDLTPADSCYPELFSEIWDEKEKTLTLEKVISGFPILDMYHDDVVYMTSQLNVQDPNGWVLAVGTSNNTLQRSVPFSTAEAYLDDTKLQCAFSKYLRETPG